MNLAQVEIGEGVSISGWSFSLQHLQWQRNE